jgi:invasion protein IalB
MARYHRIAARAAAVLIAALPAFSGAQEKNLATNEALGKFGDWQAHKFRENGKPVCTAWTQPTKDEGEYKLRGAIYLYVTHRPAEKRFNVVQIVTGYRFKKGSEAHVRIGGQTFKLFTSFDTAWARTAVIDGKLVAAMRRGNSMIVTGISSRGTNTTDTYSLKGISAAHAAINKACGFKG